MWARLNETQRAMVMDDFFVEFFGADVERIDRFIAHRMEEMGDAYRGMLLAPSKKELQGIRARLKTMLREVNDADVRGGWV